MSKYAFDSVKNGSQMPCLLKDFMGPQLVMEHRITCQFVTPERLKFLNRLFRKYREASLQARSVPVATSEFSVEKTSNPRAGVLAYRKGHRSLFSTSNCYKVRTALGAFIEE